MKAKVPGSILAASFFAALLCSSCGRPDSAPSAPSPAPAVQPAASSVELSDSADPATFSYQAVLGSAPFAELSLVEPVDPLPSSLSAGTEGLSASSPIFGNPKNGARYDPASWGTALRGAYRYRMEGTFLVAEALSTRPSDSEEAPKARELWRFRSSSALVAGPVVFDDAVVAATAKPSFIAVDRKTGTLLFERAVRVLPRGPLFYLSSSSALAALNADGSASLYGLAAPKAQASADPVEDLLRPAPEALAAMEKRIADRLGKRDERPSVIFAPYGPRDAIPLQGAVLFRADFSKDQRSRVFVENAAGRPVLVEVYSDSAEVLVSNLDYTGVDKVIDYSFAAGRVYFIACAVLSEKNVDVPGSASAAASIAPRLVVVPK